jgi:hypothetical protein
MILLDSFSNASSRSSRVGTFSKGFRVRVRVRVRFRVRV